MAENPYAHRYEVLEDGALATRPRPFWKRPELLFWPSCGLLLFGVVATAVVVGLNKTDQPDCRKSSPLAVFTPESHPDSALRQRLCGHESLFLLYGGKGKQLEAYDE